MQLRLSGPPLGRLGAADQNANRKQAQADACVRNQVEGKFGQGKRRFSLARVMAKLANTAETSIAITFLVMNLERRLRPLIWLMLGSLFGSWKPLYRHRNRPKSLVLSIPDWLPLSA